MRKFIFGALALLLPLLASAADSTITWTSVSQYSDNTLILAADIVTYNVYMNDVRVVTAATITTTKVLNHASGNNCWKVSSVVRGIESPLSVAVCKEPSAPPVTLKTPKTPGGLNVTTVFTP